MNYIYATLIPELQGLAAKIGLGMKLGYIVCVADDWDDNSLVSTAINRGFCRSLQV